MRRSFVAASLFALLAAHTFAQEDYRTIHFNAIVADGHNDVLLRVMNGRSIDERTSVGHSDLVRLKEGGVDVQVFSVWMGPDYGPGKAFHRANQMIDSLDALIGRHPDRIGLARTAAQAVSIVKEGKIAAVIGVEGGHIIEGSLDNLEALYRRGMRYMTLTWNNSPDWATSGEDEAEHASQLTHKGLTAFGRDVVRKMNDLGVMVDLSHVGEQTFYDAIAVSKKPVIVSHSSVYALAPHYRNLKDDQIRALAKNGGVMCINFYPGFLDSTYEHKAAMIRRSHRALSDSIHRIIHDEDHANDVIDSVLHREIQAIRPPLSLLVDHIVYVAKLVGVDYVGLGSDFDGIDQTPLGLDDVTGLPLITKELLRRGFSVTDVRKILGGNFLRVFAAACGGPEPDYEEARHH